MQKKLKGFTLVELLVAMAIIGVLLGLSLFGISAAQRNSRETARRAALSDINAGIADYFSQTGRFPEYLYFKQGFVVINATGAATCPTTGSCVEVPLQGAANAGTAGTRLGTTTNVTSCPTTFVGTTSADTSSYKFNKTADGYILAVMLESGTPFNAGTSNIECTTSW